MSAADLHRALATLPMRAERAQHVLTAFGVSGTVVVCERTGRRRAIADRGEYVPSSVTVERYVLGIDDGRTLTVEVEAAVSGGADGDVQATVTLLDGDQVLGTDWTSL